LTTIPDVLNQQGGKQYCIYDEKWDNQWVVGVMNQYTDGVAFMMGNKETIHYKKGIPHP
jgi:hypothetical protein